MGRTLLDPAGDRERVRRVVTALEGLPLSIELAAGQLAALPLDEVERRLEAPDELRQDPGQGLSRAIRTSWDLLPPLADTAALVAVGAVVAGRSDAAEPLEGLRTRPVPGPCGTSRRRSWPGLRAARLRARAPTAAQESCGRRPPPAGARGRGGGGGRERCGGPEHPDPPDGGGELAAAGGSAARRPAGGAGGALLAGRPGRDLVLRTGHAARAAFPPPILARLARALAEQRRSGPDGLEVEAMFAAGWPGKRTALPSMRNRVRVAVTTLRQLGLAPLARERGRGWFLDARVEIDDPRAPGPAA